MPCCYLTVVMQVVAATAAGLVVTATRLRTVTVTAVTVAVKQLVHGTTPGTMSHMQEDTEINLTLSYPPPYQPQGAPSPGGS